MATTLKQTVRALIEARQSAWRLERRLLGQLTRTFGEGKATIKQRAKRTSPTSRSLKCPKCTRRFGLPLHLGRHLAAIHGVRRKKK